MSKRRSILILVLLPLALGMARAQDSSPQSPTAAPDSGQQPETTPAPAFGQENPAPPVSENPPISGIDQPGLEPHAAPLSYLQPGLHLSQSADSNVTDTLGSSSFHSVTRALGSLTLQRLWSNYKLALDFVGGAGYYSARGIGFKQIEQLNVDQRITWKRGQLGIRDNFSYLPEGNFGGAYGSTSSQGAMLGGGSLGGQNVFLGGSQLGSLAQIPRIMNLSLVDVVENLTPKSSVTLTGGYGFAHFTGNAVDLSSGTQVSTQFLGSTQVSAQAGYNRILGPHDQAAIMYGYQGFKFSVSGLSFHSHVVQLMWGHRISGRMHFLIGAGPQIISITSGPGTDLRLSVAGRASLRYKFPKTSLSLSFDRYITNGSGFFAGAQSDIARLSVTRSLGRVWSGFADLGYARNSREQVLTPLQQSECTPTVTNPNPTCPGVVANTYAYGFAGLGVHRMIARNFHAFASYQFNYLTFDKSFCGIGLPGCNRVSQRHVGTIGIDWTPRPIRID
ncbi:MAG: hypothetical protein DMG76_11095 [Acidobacteria bacterium]|nr:MAG: hypothetical protein DMG76_11095 [Acidobacteriota bacterium]